VLLTVNLDLGKLPSSHLVGEENVQLGERKATGLWETKVAPDGAEEARGKPEKG
jgi:hypothetical protein